MQRLRLSQRKKIQDGMEEKAYKPDGAKIHSTRTYEAKNLSQKTDSNGLIFIFCSKDWQQLLIIYCVYFQK
jgi:hypothetical protein